MNFNQESCDSLAIVFTPDDNSSRVVVFFLTLKRLEVMMSEVRTDERRFCEMDEIMCFQCFIECVTNVDFMDN